MSKWRIAVIASMLAALVGCNTSSTSPETEPQSTTTTGEVTDTTRPVEQASPQSVPASDASPAPAAASTERIEKQADAEQMLALASEPAKGAPLPATEPAEMPEQATATPAYSTFDLLLPTTVAPLHVRLAVAVDGVPLQRVFEREVAQLREHIDADADGEVSWKELLDDATIVSVLAPGMPPQPPTERVLTQRYDANRNRLVDDDELLRVLAYRDAQYGACEIVANDQNRHLNRHESAVLMSLDADGDSGLDAAELRGASERLGGFDVNADGAITLGELRPTSQMNGQMRNRAGAAFGEAAVLLNEASDWNLVGESLGWLPGAAQGPLGPFREGLDIDADGWIDAFEARHLLEREPHLSIQLNLRTDETAGWGAETRFTVRDRLRDTTARVDVQGERLELTCDGLQCTFQLPPPQLIASEDATHPLRRGQIVVTAGELPDVLFGVLDQNGDGQLMARERQDATQRLVELDQEGDGKIAIAEIPDRYEMRLQWRAGTPPPVDQTGPSSDDSPRWAQALDSNRDGEISRQEFPGTAEQFAQLDQDTNGYISLDEARAVASP